MPYIHFTEEQKNRAASVDLEEFLRMHGERLTRSGKEKRMAAHFKLHPRERPLPSRHGYQIEIVDTWSMERRILDGEYQGVCEVPLEGKPYMVVFARKIRATPLPEKFDPDCLLRDLRHYPGGKNIYRLLTKTPLLGGNTFVLYDSLRHLQTMAGDVVTERMIEALCGYANDGKLLHHLFGMLKKE